MHFERAVAQRVPPRPHGRHRPLADDPGARGTGAQSWQLRRAIERRPHPRGPRRAVIIVDASAVTDFLLGRPGTVDAIEAALAGAEQQPLHAPELIEPETLNALRRLVAHGRVD